MDTGQISEIFDQENRRPKEISSVNISTSMTFTVSPHHMLYRISL